MPSTSEHTNARLRHIPKYTSSYVGDRAAAIGYAGSSARRCGGVQRSRVPNMQASSRILPPMA